MTVKECYECLGADYEDVSCRLRSEERILKFLKMVLKDTSFKDLCDAMEEQDYEKAFRAVHTLKGVLLNLGLTDREDMRRLLRKRCAADRKMRK